MLFYFDLEFDWHMLLSGLVRLIFLSLVLMESVCVPQSFLLAFIGPVSLQIMTWLPEDLGLSGMPCSTYGLNGTALHSLHTCTPTPAHSRSLTHATDVLCTFNIIENSVLMH